MYPLSNNAMVSMTRRYPDLAKKKLLRDHKFAKKMIQAWDVENDAGKVFELFLDEKGQLSDERYWEFLRSVWIVAGNLDRTPVFLLLMQSKRKMKHYFSTPEECKRFQSLPEEIIVYRACNDEKDGGIAWTLSLDYAKSYQKMFEKEIILEKKINKNLVFALIDRNKEEEVIIL